MTIPAQQAAPWSPDQFWQYVEGLAGDHEAGQMREMLASQGLQLVSRPPQATPNNIRSVSQWIEDPRCLMVWFADPVTEADRAWLRVALETVPAADAKTIGEWDAAITEAAERIEELEAELDAKRISAAGIETGQADDIVRVGGVTVPGKMKLVYVKRWRTLIPVPEIYADEIVAALATQPQSPAVTESLPDWKQDQADTSVMQRKPLPAESAEDLGAWLHDYDYGEDHEPNADCVNQYLAMGRALLAKYDVRRRA